MDQQMVWDLFTNCIEASEILKIDQPFRERLSEMRQRLAPQKIGWTLTPALPISLIAFCAAFAGWLLTDPKSETRFHYRQGLMVFLLLYCFYIHPLPLLLLDT